MLCIEQGNSSHIKHHCSGPQEHAVAKSMGARTSFQCGCRCNLWGTPVPVDYARFDLFSEVGVRKRMLGKFGEFGEFGELFDR